MFTAPPSRPQHWPPHSTKVTFASLLRLNLAHFPHQLLRLHHFLHRHSHRFLLRLPRQLDRFPDYCFHPLQPRLPLRPPPPRNPAGTILCTAISIARTLLGITGRIRHRWTPPRRPRHLPAGPAANSAWLSRCRPCRCGHGPVGTKINGQKIVWRGKLGGERNPPAEDTALLISNETYLEVGKHLSDLVFVVLHLRDWVAWQI